MAAPASGGATMDAAEWDGAGGRPAGLGDERRLTVRAYHRWAGLLGEGSCPPIAAASALLALPGFSPHLIVLDRRAGWIIRILGERLIEVCGGRPGRLPARPPASALLLGIAEACGHVLERNGPAELESRACGHDGATILYRGAQGWRRSCRPPITVKRC